MSSCPICETRITAIGECQCNEVFPTDQDLDLYRHQFLQLIRYFIGIGLPNPLHTSQRLQELGGNFYALIGSSDLRNRMLDCVHFYMNSVFIRLDGVFDDIRFDTYPGIVIYPTSSQTNDSENQSAPVEEISNNITINSRPSSTLHVRVRNLLVCTEIDILCPGMDWQSILHGIESNTVDLAWRFYEPEPYFEGYSGYDSDYTEEFERIANESIIESENNSSLRGPPPAAKSAIENLQREVIERMESECRLCSVCQDVISKGDFTKRLPCEHVHHEECIVKWLSYRNFCPICKYELSTDDREYEEQKRRNQTLEQ